MRVKLALISVALAAGAHSCAGTGQNTANIFTEQTNTITLAVEVPPDQGDITSVEFSVDGQQIAVDSEGPEWAVQFDTTKVQNGVHYVRAIGNPGAGDVVLLENCIVVRNGGGATGGTTPTDAPTTEEAL
jgi:hypothetical protein